jgi:ribokinase
LGNYIIRKNIKMKDKKSIIVIGSTNTDMVVRADHIPVPGETILGGTFFMNPGGKGANQAVAAARLGGDVTFICKTGTDIFGKDSSQLFAKEGINTGFVLQDEENPSGVALITVSDNAENSIVVAPGANSSLNPGEINKAGSIIGKAGAILIQLEIPIDTVKEAVLTAHKNGTLVVLNPAPAAKLSDDILKCVDIITPNETEAAILTGISVTDISSAEKAAIALHEKGINTVIITMGSKGAMLYHEDKKTVIPAPVVKAVDTTAAGDVFNGALVVALSEGMGMTEAVIFACRASSISVTRQGAQSSAPYRKELC